MSEPADIIMLDDYREVTPEERLELIAADAASGLGHGPKRARETLIVLAVVLADLLPYADEVGS